MHGCEPYLLAAEPHQAAEELVAGTNCPIPPAANYTYKFQSKDQAGTFTYFFPSLAMHRASSGGFGALNVYRRPAIPVPYPPPAGDFTLLLDRRLVQNRAQGTYVTNSLHIDRWYAVRASN
jgi:hypothetical protein